VNRWATGFRVTYTIEGGETHRRVPIFGATPAHDETHLRRFLQVVGTREYGIINPEEAVVEPMPPEELERISRTYHGFLHPLHAGWTTITTREEA
jgi:hypothetical protein